MGSNALAVVPKIPVLNYHHVHDEDESFFRVTPQTLCAQMDLLLAEGYTPIHPDRLRALKGRTRKPEKHVLVTFDDAYDDFLIHAWPVLKARGIPTLLFVITDFIGGLNEWDDIRVSSRRHLTLDQLRQLHAEGVVIGSHSCTHAALTYLDPVEQERQISQSRLDLETLFGGVISSIAYPGGHVDDKVARLAARHYALGFATAPEVHGRFHDAYFIPRLDPCFFAEPDEFVAELRRYSEV